MAGSFCRAFLVREPQIFSLRDATAGVMGLSVGNVFELLFIVHLVEEHLVIELL